MPTTYPSVSTKVSISPYGERYPVQESNQKVLYDFKKNHHDKKVVVVQGLGFVGSAMLAAVSMARDEHHRKKYAVIGVDFSDENNYWKIGRVNQGLVPIISQDQSLEEAYAEALRDGNMMATGNPEAYQLADVVIVDINLDVQKKGLGRSAERQVDLEYYKANLRVVAQNIKPNCLVIIETTVPPGTCSKVLLPLFEEEFQKRGFRDAEVDMAHSYERVMPGRNYLKSIISYYRVFAASNRRAAEKTREFLKSFIHTSDFPLVELAAMTDSEMAKVLENSFRATNIALLQEWTEFSDLAGVSLFEVIQAIRMRATHQNIMAPGFGVGGYCLTKDPLLADWAYESLFHSEAHLSLSVQAVDINDLMPTYSFRLLKSQFPSLKGKRILILGVSYLKDVADTRSSPTELFYDLCRAEEAEVFLHDPLVRFWKEKKLLINTDLAKSKFQQVDAVVLAVSHDQYSNLDADSFLQITGSPKVVLDTNNVFSDEMAQSLAQRGVSMIGVGKGHWKKWHRSITYD